MGNTLDFKNQLESVNSTSCFKPRDKNEGRHSSRSSMSRFEELQIAMNEIRNHNLNFGANGRKKDIEHYNWTNRGFLNQELISEGSRKSRRTKSMSVASK